MRAIGQGGSSLHSNAASAKTDSVRGSGDPGSGTDSVPLFPLPLGANVALASGGATAIASSRHSPSYPASAVINGDRRGAAYGTGGVWQDAGAGLPDWLRVDFAQPYTISEVDVFSLQEDTIDPAEPTPTLASRLALRDFRLEYWDGWRWLTLPGGTVVGNTLVWARVIFPAVTTSRIRIWITKVAANRSRVTEVEVYLAASSDDRPTDTPPSNAPPTVTLTSPRDGITHDAPATVTVTAAASDADGTVSEVEFYANAALIGSANAAPFSILWSSVSAGSYTLTAKATDNNRAEGTSARVGLTVVAPAEDAPPPQGPMARSVNVALGSAGATASASSSYSSRYPPSAVIDGERSGAPWGDGGAWQDKCAGLPDWLQVDLAQAYTITEVDVFSLQENAVDPFEPTPTLTSSLAPRDFHLEYWDGAQWTTVPGSSVVGNTQVWTQVTFPAITTTRVRLVVTRTAGNRSRISEFEVFTAP